MFCFVWSLVIDHNTLLFVWVYYQPVRISLCGSLFQLRKPSSFIRWFAKMCLNSYNILSAFCIRYSKLHWCNNILLSSFIWMRMSFYVHKFRIHIGKNIKIRNKIFFKNSTVLKINNLECSVRVNIVCALRWFYCHMIRVHYRL